MGKYLLQLPGCPDALYFHLSLPDYHQVIGLLYSGGIHPYALQTREIVKYSRFGHAEVYVKGIVVKTVGFEKKDRVLQMAGFCGLLYFHAEGVRESISYPPDLFQAGAVTHFRAEAVPVIQRLIQEPVPVISESQQQQEDGGGNNSQ
jgi:hypothetical protein